MSHVRSGFRTMWSAHNFTSGLYKDWTTRFGSAMSDISCLLVIHSGYDDIYAAENSAEGARLRRVRAVDDRVYVALANPTSWSEEELAQAWSDDMRSGESVWDRARRDTQAWLAQFDRSE
ncbi:hypothetical protein B0H13DRAFT_1883832 [Mycena leptocephala]|nr:hypothetical protein B0H13DRAFT_1884554 [Mycena leptocephala]KAJ7899649.1 hypothetical protein B0H13DRAFT_1883832 [Mycena leptocephala]